MVRLFNYTNTVLTITLYDISHFDNKLIISPQTLYVAVVSQIQL